MTVPTMIILIACAAVFLFGIGRVFTGYDIADGLAMIVVSMILAYGAYSYGDRLFDTELTVKPAVIESDPVEMIDSTELTEADTVSASTSEPAADWDEEEDAEPVHVVIVSDDELSDEELHAIIEDIVEDEEMADME